MFDMYQRYTHECFRHKVLKPHVFPIFEHPLWCAVLSTLFSGGPTSAIIFYWQIWIRKSEPGSLWFWCEEDLLWTGWRMVSHWGRTDVFRIKVKVAMNRWNRKLIHRSEIISDKNIWFLKHFRITGILLLESPCSLVRPEQNFSRIIHTCSIVKYQGSWMYASYINTSCTYA